MYARARKANLLNPERSRTSSSGLELRIKKRHRIMPVPLSGLCSVFVRFDCPQGCNVEPLIYEFAFVESHVLLIEATAIFT